MKAFERIQLAFKCPKSLDELQPCQSNWYCDGCKQMVYDFRGFTEEAILDKFAQSGQKLCGIYDADRIKILPQPRRWYKLVPAAMLLTGLAACRQPANHSVGESVVIPVHTAGIVMPPMTNTNTIGKVVTSHRKKAIAFPPPNVMVGDVKISEPKPNETKPMIETRVIEIDSTKADTNTIFGGAVEIMPTFPGGDTGFKNYTGQHLNYSGNFKGKVFVSFVVEVDGTLSGIKIIRGGEPELDKKIIKLMENCPHWIPGVQNGKKYRSVYTVPINVQ